FIILCLYDIACDVQIVETPLLHTDHYLIAGTADELISASSVAVSQHTALNGPVNFVIITNNHNILFSILDLDPVCKLLHSTPSFLISIIYICKESIKIKTHNYQKIKSCSGNFHLSATLHAISFVFQFQNRHDFNVRTVRKQINRLNLFECIAEFSQPCNVVGK